MKKFFKKDNVIYGIILIAISLGSTFLLACLFSAFRFGNAPFIDRFVAMFKAMFWMFGAGAALGGILAITIPSIGDHCFGFGMALYYGTILLSGFLDNFIIADQSDRLIISFVIVALLCYVYWLKFEKKSDT